MPYSSEPWPDTWTLVSIDTRTPSTRPTLVSIDTPPTLLRHTQTLQTGNSDRETRGSCLSSVNSVKLRHSDTSDTADTPDTPTLDTPTRSDTTHASPCPTTLRHWSDTGQTPPTPSTPVSIDTAPTLLRHYFDTPRHYSDTSDTSDTQTHQGSRRSCWPMGRRPSCIFKGWRRSRSPSARGTRASWPC